MVSRLGSPREGLCDSREVAQTARKKMVDGVWESVIQSVSPMGTSDFVLLKPTQVYLPRSRRICLPGCWHGHGIREGSWRKSTWCREMRVKCKIWIVDARYVFRSRLYSRQGCFLGLMMSMSKEWEGDERRDSPGPWFCIIKQKKKRSETKTVSKEYTGLWMLLMDNSMTRTSSCNRQSFARTWWCLQENDND